MPKLIIRLACLCSLILVSHPTLADELTLDFDLMSGDECGTAWDMSGVTMQVYDTSRCQSLPSQFGWCVADACIEFDLTDLPDLRSVSLSFYNFRDIGSVFVQVLDDVVPLAEYACTETEETETIVADVEGVPATRLRIYCDFFLFHSATFRFGPVATEIGTWGAVKAAYR